MFLHGIGCCKENFAPCWRMLAVGDAALWAPDLPGHGQSASVPPAACSMEAMADAVAADIERIADGARVHIIAHSMGGAVGLLAVERLDAPLASFINVEGNLVAEDCSLLSRRTAETPRDEFVNERFDRLRARAATAEDPIIRHWAKWLEPCSPAGFHVAACSLVEWSDTGRLLDIYLSLTVPTLYVYGESSANPDVIRHLQAVAKKRIDGCGHFPMVEAPAEFADIVSQFVTAP